MTRAAPALRDGSALQAGERQELNLHLTSRLTSLKCFHRDHQKLFKAWELHTAQRYCQKLLLPTEAKPWITSNLLL